MAYQYTILHQGTEHYVLSHPPGFILRNKRNCMPLPQPLHLMHNTRAHWFRMRVPSAVAVDCGAGMSRTRTNIRLARVVIYTYGTYRLVFWHGGGSAFCGKGAHMRALKYARKS